MRWVSTNDALPDRSMDCFVRRDLSLSHKTATAIVYQYQPFYPETYCLNPRFGAVIPDCRSPRFDVTHWMEIIEP